MPTYEYECQKCDHRFELLQSIKDKPKKVCPKCRGRVRRLIGSGTGLIFKGSGFYATDYRKPGYSEAAKRESGSAAGATSSSNPGATKSSGSKTSTKKD